MARNAMRLAFVEECAQFVVIGVEPQIVANEKIKAAVGIEISPRAGRPETCVIQIQAGRKFVESAVPIIPMKPIHAVIRDVDVPEAVVIEITDGNPHRIVKIDQA